MCRQASILVILVLALMCFIGFCGCSKNEDYMTDARDSTGHTMAELPPDWPQSLPAEQDTCIDPVEITDPPFVTLDIEITEPSPGEQIFCAGPWCDTISIDEGGEKAQIVYNVLKKYNPAYDYKVYVLPDDNRRMAIIVPGTNDVNLFKQKLWMRYNGTFKHYLGWARQGFIFSGALKESQYMEVIKIFPSVDIFNFRLTEYDSLMYIDLALAILGECKEGRTWADFRFNPYEMTDSIVQAFDDAGWNKVLHFGATGTRDAHYADLRARCIYPWDIEKLLDIGYQVLLTRDQESVLQEWLACR